MRRRAKPVAWIAVSILVLASGAAADPVSERAVGGSRKIQLAAADAVGWLVFPEKRQGPAEDYAGHPLPLRNALGGEGQATPPLDWLDRWGLVQLRATR
jgi:hypothetical protein